MFNGSNDINTYCRKTFAVANFGTKILNVDDFDAKFIRIMCLIIITYLEASTEFENLIHEPV